MNNFKKSAFLLVACSLSLMASTAHARGDQWYVGIGGGSSWLQPNPEEPGLGLDTRLGVGGNLFFGVDIDDRSSGQLTLYGFGESELENGETVPYAAVDGSILYRVYDSNDARLRPSRVSLALYGRFALGYMHRDTDIDLSHDTAVYFGLGGGLELFLTNNFSLRLEGMYHDEDAASGSLQFVGRFGGVRRAIPRRTGPAAPLPEIPATPDAPSAPTVPSVDAPISTLPAVPVAPTTPLPPVVAGPDSPLTASPALSDADGDSVPDSTDRCPQSRPGFPVRATGCALFDGVLSGISFAQGSPLLRPGSADQLDFLANVLIEYPQAKIELHAHTDNLGTVRDQAILTRARLRTIGMYLVEKGVRSNRLVLRSFGGTRPLYDNKITEGQIGNNRIEVIENSD